MTSTVEFDEEFFVTAAQRVSNPTCFTLGFREDLIKAAVKKNGKPRDETSENLLFPPTVIRRILVREKVAQVLGCECSICRSVHGRDLLTDNQLIDVVTTEEGVEQRRLFAVLVFMGAGFAARHLCSFHTRGWDFTTQENSIRSDLFEPLNLGQLAGMPRDFPAPARVVEIFLAIFNMTRRLFASPVMRLRSHETTLSGENLPFIRDHLLLGDKSSFGSLYAFEIHQEFREHNIPARAVRKELKFGDTADEERRILEFLARCNKPNFIRLLFWYRYYDKINFVFPHYPSSLQQVLEGEMNDQIRSSEVFKYGPKLKHWLWQGMVDIIQALKFFHFPEQNILPGEIIAAHFDMKPANILVDESSTLIITDFGQARIRSFRAARGTALTAQVGDPNYKPPPLSQGTVGMASPESEPKWSRAYDVWSMACIMTEVIEYITQGGSKGYISFRDRRFNEDKASSAFWKVGLRGGYELKNSVQETLLRFRDFQDRYLDMVTNLLETMFSIDPLLRPAMADCLTIISEDIPADEWPLKEDDEISICGLGTNPQLRNMHTKFQRNSEREAHRCKMYFLSSNLTKRLRLALEFKKEVIDGPTRSEVTWVLSDSARREEEKYEPLTLFSPDYRAVIGNPFVCSFSTVHPNLRFIFDDALRGPNEYYHFLTAATRQRCLRSHVYMPISKCTVRMSQILVKKHTFDGGHIQIWRQLLDDEYENEFTYISPARRPSDASHSVPASPQNRQDSTSSQLSRATGSLARSSIKVAGQVKTHRLVVFIPGPPSRCLTINLTNKFNRSHLGQNASNHLLPRHITFTALRGNFHIGNLTSDRHCPGIPLDPEKLEEQENCHVDWVEIEFKTDTAMARFNDLWNKLFPD